MDGIPLRQVLTLAPLQHAHIIAGAAGLDRLVRFVNVMEVPDIVAWVKPDELLLTTAYPLRDESAALVELVPQLAEKGLAGLAVKPARYIDAIPSTMVEAAERLDFPLLELPPEISFDDVINSVLSAILNVQALRLQRSAAIHERFTEIVLRGGGLREIVRTLAELINRPVALVDPSGGMLAGSESGSLSDVMRADALWPSSLTPSDGRLHVVPIARAGRSAQAALQPIQVGGELLAVLVVVIEGEALGEEELMALEHAATVAALRMVQTRAVAETDRRFKAVCLEELVAGHITDRTVLHERAVAFGWNLSIERAVLVTELEELSRQPFTELVATPKEAWALHRLAEAAAMVLGRGAIVWERSAGIAALLETNCRGNAGCRDAAARLQAEARRQLAGAVVAVGIGRPYKDPLELHRSHAEALQGIVTGRWARGLGKISIFEELGLDRLLFSCPDGELSAFCEATIGPLAAYDAVHHADLVKTLEAFFACNRNAALAARSLYIHYNTLKHRLDRIEAIIGPFVDDQEHCLNLALALRIHRFSGNDYE